MGQVVFYRQITTEVGDGLPQDAVLHLVGNHPNPFNPQTVIQYHLARSGDVTVSVFDAEGNLVRTVERRHGAAGLQTWTWQGRDDAGRLVPSGVYLYEVRVGTERVGGKMLLLKCPYPSRREKPAAGSTPAAGQCHEAIVVTSTPPGPAAPGWQSVPGSGC